MYYENEETGLGILVSNPRDSVSPFCCVLEGKEYRHQWWGLDRFLPGFKPLPGMYFFRDVTPEEAQEYAERRIAQFVGTEFEVPDADHARVLASLKAQFVGTPKLDRTPK
jgi:hypothetical protein